MSTQFIVLTGSPISGFNAHGPFGSEEEAELFGDSMEDNEFWVMPLNQDSVSNTLNVIQLIVNNDRYQNTNSGV